MKTIYEQVYDRLSDRAKTFVSREAVAEVLAAIASDAAQAPAGWKLVRVNEHFDALIASLERAESKGYLPDSVREEWENFACDENVIAPQPPEPADERDKG